LAFERFRLRVQALEDTRDLWEPLLVLPLEADLAHRHEEIGKTEQVVLLPDVVRMAMALGALQPETKEGVCYLQRRIHSRRTAALPVQVERPSLAVHFQILAARRVAFLHLYHLARPGFDIAPLSAGGGQDALDELVIGGVLLQPGPNPGLKAWSIDL